MCFLDKLFRANLRLRETHDSGKLTTYPSPLRAKYWRGNGGQGNTLERAAEIEPNLVGNFPESYADF